MANVRAEGWKEVKIGAIFEGYVPGQSGQVRGRSQSYVMHLGGPDGSTSATLVAGCPECCGWRRRSLDQRVTILMPLISWTGITLSNICVALLYPNQPEQAAAWVDQD